MKAHVSSDSWGRRERLIALAITFIMLAVILFIVSVRSADAAACTPVTGQAQLGPVVCGLVGCKSTAETYILGVRRTPTIWVAKSAKQGQFVQVTGCLNEGTGRVTLRLAK